MEKRLDHGATRAETAAWVGTLDLLGMPEEALISVANERGTQIRVISRDGETFLVRADRRPNPVNVDVVDGLITGVYGVY